jgi:hypothetical protein
MLGHLLSGKWGYPDERRGIVDECRGIVDEGKSRSREWTWDGICIAKAGLVRERAGMKREARRLMRRTWST